MNGTLPFHIVWQLAQKHTQNGFTFATYTNTLKNTTKTAKLLSYDNTESTAHNVVIPKTITINGESYTIIAVDSKAFSGKENLLRVTIPNTITDIYSQAFENSSITEVIFEEQSQLKQIHKKAFCGCQNLKAVSIPASVVNIANKAFYNCNCVVTFASQSNLHQIGSQAFSGDARENTCAVSEIPDSVTYIGQKAFAINRTAEIKFNKESALSTLSTAVFAESSIQKIYIPKKLSKISTRTFYACESLQQIEFGDYNQSIKTIDTQAFNNCKSLKSIKIPASVEAIKERAFLNCNNLESVELEANSNLASIDDYAFSHCVNLVNIINLPEDIEYGKEGVFDGCDKLANVNGGNGIINQLTSTLIHGLANKEIPEDVIEIGEHAFAGLASLVSLVLPENITTIARNAFLNCTGLKEIFIPKSVLFMKSNAFKGCTGLTIKCAFKSQPVTWATDWNPDNCPVIWGCKDSTICDSYLAFTPLEDGTYAVSAGASKLPNRLEIPGYYNGKQVSTIAASGFRNCNIHYVDIMPGITTIGEEAFKECSLLMDVNFPDTVKYIKMDAFCRCTQLDLIQLPENLQELEWGAFRDCDKAQTVYIPKSVKTIKNGAFLGRNVTDRIIYCENTAAEIASKSWDSYWHSKRVTDEVADQIDNFLEKYLNLDLYSVDEYEIKYNAAAVTDSSNFRFTELSDGTYRIRPKEALVVMHVPKYYNNKLVTELSGWWSESSVKQASLVKVILPDSIKTINGQAFKGCYNLNEINIPSSVTTIRMYAFGGNRAGYYDELSGSSITKIVIPDSVTSGDEGLFKGCQNLRHVTLPDHWEEINTDMFNYCTSLTDIVLPTNCKYIGAGAFTDCSSLTTVHITNKYWMAGDTYLDLSTRTAEEVATLVKQYHNVVWKATTPMAPEITCKINRSAVNCSIRNPNPTPRTVTLKAVFIYDSEGYNKLVSKYSEINTIGANKTIETFFSTPFDASYNYTLDFTHVTITAQFEQEAKTMATYLSTGKSSTTAALSTEDDRNITDEKENLLVITGVNYTDVKIIDPVITYNGYQTNQTTHSFTIANYNDFDVTCTWSGGDAAETGTTTIVANSSYNCNVTDSADEANFAAQFVYGDITSSLVSRSYTPPSEFNFKLTYDSDGITKVEAYTEVIRTDETKNITICAGLNYTVSAYVTNADYTLVKDKLGLVYTLSVYNARGNVKVLLNAIKRSFIGNEMVHI